MSSIRDFSTAQQWLMQYSYSCFANEVFWTIPCQKDFADPIESLYDRLVGSGNARNYEFRCRSLPHQTGEMAERSKAPA